MTGDSEVQVVGSQTCVLMALAGLGSKDQITKILSDLNPIRLINSASGVGDSGSFLHNTTSFFDQTTNFPLVTELERCEIVCHKQQCCGVGCSEI